MHIKYNLLEICLDLIKSDKIFYVLKNQFLLFFSLTLFLLQLFFNFQNTYPEQMSNNSIEKLKLILKRLKKMDFHKKAHLQTIYYEVKQNF